MKERRRGASIEMYPGSLKRRGERECREVEERLALPLLPILLSNGHVLHRNQQQNS
jgi:hypothetical protein